MYSNHRALRKILFLTYFGDPKQLHNSSNIYYEAYINTSINITYTRYSVLLLFHIRQFEAAFRHVFKNVLENNYTVEQIGSRT
jgi:hypothetical protein